MSGTRECDGQVVVASRGELDLADAAGVAAALAAVAARERDIIVNLHPGMLSASSRRRCGSSPLADEPPTGTPGT